MIPDRDLRVTRGTAPDVRPRYHYAIHQGVQTAAGLHPLCMPRLLARGYWVAAPTAAPIDCQRCVSLLKERQS